MRLKTPVFSLESPKKKIAPTPKPNAVLLRPHSALKQIDSSQRLLNRLSSITILMFIAIGCQIGFSVYFIWIKNPTFQPSTTTIATTAPTITISNQTTTAIVTTGIGTKTVILFTQSILVLSSLKFI